MAQTLISPVTASAAPAQIELPEKGAARTHSGQSVPSRRKRGSAKAQSGHPTLTQGRATQSRSRSRGKPTDQPVAQQAKAAKGAKTRAPIPAAANHAASVGGASVQEANADVMAGSDTAAGAGVEATPGSDLALRVDSSLRALQVRYCKGFRPGRPVLHCKRFPEY